MRCGEGGRINDSLLSFVNLLTRLRVEFVQQTGCHDAQTSYIQKKNENNCKRIGPNVAQPTTSCSMACGDFYYEKKKKLLNLEGFVYFAFDFDGLFAINSENFI